MLSAETQMEIKTNTLIAKICWIFCQNILRYLEKDSRRCWSLAFKCAHIIGINAVSVYVLGYYLLFQMLLQILLLRQGVQCWGFVLAHETQNLPPFSLQNLSLPERRGGGGVRARKKEAVSRGCRTLPVLWYFLHFKLTPAPPPSFPQRAEQGYSCYYFLSL